MKKINKISPFSDFEQFVFKNKPTLWEELPNEIRTNTRMYILCEEQDCLCGYSEIILEEDSFYSHIDHYYKRNLFPQKTYAWNNLIVSTIDEDFGGKYKDDTYRIKANEYSQIFNPVVDDMSQYIEYSGNGEIIPIEGLSPDIINKVKKTIEVFNLNHTSLNNRRKTLLSSLNACKDLPQEEILRSFSNKGFTSVLYWFLKTI